MRLMCKTSSRRQNNKMFGKLNKELVGIALGALLAPAAVLANSDAGNYLAPQDWPMFNQDAQGTRTNNSFTSPFPWQLRAKGLEVKWSIQTAGAVNSTPAVVGGVVYASDTLGNVYARNAETGAAVWTRSGLRRITSSPLVVGNRVIVAEIGRPELEGADSQRRPGDQGRIVGLYRTAEGSKAAGSIAYIIDAVALGNESPQLSFDGSAMLARGAKNGKDLAIIGMASAEENATLDPNYNCCSFRGGVAAFDPNTGAVAWVRYLVTPQEKAAGTSGSPVWSTPTYDQAAKRLYVSTGNNYSPPANATSDAVLALDPSNGNILWTRQLTANDTWNFRFPVDDVTPDADFGDSVNVITLLNGRKVLTVGQKSGFIHMLDATTGALLSQYDVVPFGLVGGLFADSAYAYGLTFVNGVTQWCDPSTFQCADTIHDGFPKSGTVAAYTSFTSNLHELWRFETPGPGLAAVSGLAVANAVLYVHAVDFFATGNDKLFALNALTGELLTTLSLQGLAGVSQGISGPSIVGNRLYLGTGLVASGFFNSSPGSITAIGLKP